MRLAQAYERGGDEGDPLERAWKRIMTPAAKLWVCKRGVELTGEAMEVLGGNGYVDTGVMARLFREAPVNSIWEGSGNVMRSEEHTSELQSPCNLVCRLLLEKKKILTKRNLSRGIARSVWIIASSAG